MFKYSWKLNGQTLKRAHKIWDVQRHHSSKSFLSGSQKGILGGILLVGTGTAGTLGYANYSPENRKQLENYIPSQIFTTILGPAELPSKPQLTLQQDSLLKKKLQRESQKEPKQDIDSSKPVEEEKISPSLDKSSDHEETIDEISPVILPEDSSSSDISEIELKSFGERLKNTLLEGQQQIEKAVEIYDDLKDLFKSYHDKAHEAINSGGEKILFEQAKELAKKKEEKVKEYEEKIQLLQQYLVDLEKATVEGKEDSTTMEEPSLGLAENFISDLKTTMQKMQLDVADLVKTSAATSALQNLVEQGKQKFEEEITMLLPDVKIGGKLTEEQQDVLIAHAHSRILALQKELAKHMTVEKSHDPSQSSFDPAIMKADRRLKFELDRQKYELTMEYRRTMAQMRDNFELELRTQLKRQAAAHSDHLAEMLHSQEFGLEQRFVAQLAHELDIERHKYVAALSVLAGRLEGLDASLESRAQVDAAAHRSHELWMTCQAFKNALRLGNPNSSSWQDQLRPLGKDANAIRNITGNTDPFVEAVLGSLTNNTLERGVYTESALRERFIKVNKICRRVAMIGDNGGSLIKYLISYIRSFWLMDSFEQIPVSEIQNEDIDIEKLDTYSILDRTKYYLEKDDLLQSVRYMKLLRGEAKHVAKDWIQEAILTLEAKQAADALMTYATATGAKAL